MSGRQLNTCFDLLQPQLDFTVFKKRGETKQSLNRYTKKWDFHVYVSTHFSKEIPVKWIPSNVVECRGNVTFIIHLENWNSCVRRHKNQMRHNYLAEIEVSLNQAPMLVTHYVNERRYPTTNRQNPQCFDKES